MKKYGLLCGFLAISMSVCAFTSAVSAASLFSGSADDKKDYIIAADAYTDYSNLGAIEVVVTASGSASGCIGVTGADRSWISANNSTTAGTSTWRLDGLNGILAVTGEACIHIQFWSVDSGTYSVDKVTLYDTDGKVILPGDKVVEREVIKLPDAEKERMFNDKFKFGRKFDIAAAVGDNFDDIAAIDVTVKWSNADYGWSGGGNVYGVEQADGTSGSWLSSKPMGNVEENAALRSTATEATYRAFDFSKNPIVKLTSTGITGEISGYATMGLDIWWTDNSEVDPIISNITIYNSKGKVLASLDYKTRYDTLAADNTIAATEAVTQEAVTTTSEDTTTAEETTTTTTTTEAITTTSAETTAATTTTAETTTAAEATTSAAIAETEAANPNSSDNDTNYTVIIVIVAAAVVIIGGATAFFVLRKKK